MMTVTTTTAAAVAAMAAETTTTTMMQPSQTQNQMKIYRRKHTCLVWILIRVPSKAVLQHVEDS